MLKHDEYLTCHPLQNSQNTVAAVLSGCLSKETKKPLEGGNWRFCPASIYRGGYQNREEPIQSNPMGSCKAQSAMQRPRSGPQTLSAATALAVAVQEQHNAVHDTSARCALERTEA